MIADQAERDRALDPARSFIVQAPAGSGKTSLLVARYLALLKVVKQPEEILAITFTRKAAAEMRNRVLGAIPHAAEIAHRLRIETIDAFCASLARQLPVLAKFGAPPAIVEDASELYDAAALETAMDFANPSVARLLAHLDNNVGAATTLLAAMLRKRDQWLRKAGHPPSRPELEAVLEAERARLISHSQTLDPRASEGFAKEVLTKEGGWRKRSKEAQALVDNEPLRIALKSLLSLPSAKYSDAQWEALEAMLALLPLAAAQLKLVFAGRGQADFTEISQGAVRALGPPDEPTDLLLALDARISHVLVDEFQDTSVSQWELLERLTAGWQPGDGRTLFAVGDPMQSIYRFREAEVALFLRAWDEGLPNVPLERITLTTNFRSQPNLVGWFNAVFPRDVPATSGPEIPALAGDAVTWHGFYDREAEARRVVELVGAAVGKAAILVRNRSHLDAIVPALKRAGIRFRAVEIEQLGEKQIVQDLYALTRALTHPADRVAWLAILRAPWCGLSLEDLLSVVPANAGTQTIWELMQDQPSLSRIRDVLRPALDNRLRGTLRDRVEGVWVALGGPACVADATDLEDAGVFLDELEKLEEAGDLPDLGLLAQKLEKLWALPDVGAGPDAVEIMTIHKAKGLEFDVVIVPGLDRAPRSGEKPLLLFKSLVDGKLLLAPINETGSGDDPVYDYVRELDKEAEDVEAGRLFYVAATRAAARLHLLACAKADEAGKAKSPNKRSLLAKAWFAAAESFPIAPAEEPAQAPTAPPPAPILRRLPESYQLPPPTEPARWAVPAEGREEERIEFSWAGETARHVGTVVHRWLQRIAEDELKGWDAKRVESLRSHFERDLYSRGVQTPGPAAELVVYALKNTLADERGRWLLGTHPEAKSEYRIRTRERSFVIDRMFRDKDGVRWVVDYKTSRHEGANLEAFLDQERTRYAIQLEAYSAALADARRGLYFPLLAGWRSW